MDDQLFQERIGRSLRDAAAHVELQPMSERNVVSTGRRRRQRRRQAGSLCAVAAVATATTVAVQQLTRNGDSSISTTETVDTLPATPESSPPDPATVPTSTVVPAGGADVVAHPVAMVESNYVWQVVEPDETEAVGHVVAAGSSPTAPGIALSTAGGSSSGDYRAQFWQTDDGVRWTPLDIDVPLNSLNRSVVRDRAIYSVGTAPGVAATDPNPLAVAISNDAGGTWSTVDLPFDANAGEPGTTRSVDPTLVPLDDGSVAVLAIVRPSIDYGPVLERLPAVAPGAVDANGDAMVVGESADGVQVYDDLPCEPGRNGIPSTTIPESIATSTTSTTVLGGPDAGTTDPAGECTVRTVPWADLGVSPEAVAEVFGGARLEAWVVRDGVASALQTPPFDGDGWIESFPYEAIVRVADGSGFRLGGDGTFSAIDDTTRPSGYADLGANSSTRFALGSTASAYGNGSLVLGADAGGGWTWYDWSSVAGNDRVVDSLYASAVTERGVVTAGLSRLDTVAIAGGVTVSSDGITISRSSIRVEPDIVVDATGVRLGRDALVWRDDGTVAVVGSGGEVLATFAGADVDRMFGCCGDDAPSWFVGSSVNGGDVAVESIATLLGVDDADIGSVNRITGAGDGTVAVAVSLTENRPSGVPRQLVLVGTPKQ